MIEWIKDWMLAGLLLAYIGNLSLQYSAGKMEGLDWLWSAIIIICWPVPVIYGIVTSIRDQWRARCQSSK
jgi:hypothetical protein